MSEEYEPDDKDDLPRDRDAQARAALRRQRFYDLVVKAIDALPPEFKEKLENLDVVVVDWPSPFQLGRANIRNRFGLLGLYEGVPQTSRSGSYGMSLPDKITIFRKPIEVRCHSWQEIEAEVVRVVRHEIAHHFGIDDHTLRIIENDKRRGHP